METFSSIRLGICSKKHQAESISQSRKPLMFTENGSMISMKWRSREEGEFGNLGDFSSLSGQDACLAKTEE
ncbi:unnamed protein product [Rhizophagus irregularis]|nr:unnamed protein product [Rhizophagus irregularis]